MWLFFQIVAYLAVAFAIGAAGAWILRSRMAEDSLEHLRQRFRQMVSSSEMERDAARLRVRELAQRIEELEDRLEGGAPDASSAAETAASEAPAAGPRGRRAVPSRPRSGASRIDTNDAAEAAETPGREPTIAAPSEYGSVHFTSDEGDGAGDTASWSESWGRFDEEPDPAPASVEAPEAAGDTVGPSRASEDPRAVPGPQKVADARAAGETERAAGGGHPLSHLGEVPPEVANALRSMGIPDTTALHHHFQNGYDPAAMARELDISPRRIRRWRILAELLEVPGLVPESAWLLEISGVASLTELSAEDPGELADRMAGINRDQGLGLPSPTQDEVASWVLWASHAGAVQV